MMTELLIDTPAPGDSAPASVPAVAPPRTITSLPRTARPASVAGLRPAVLHGADAGAHVAALWGGLDAVAVASFGQCIPWALLPIVIGGYLVAGSLGGAALGGLCRLRVLRRGAASPTEPGVVERLILIACLVTCGATFAARFFLTGGETGMAWPLIGAAVVGGVVFVLCHRAWKRWPVGRNPRAGFSWAVLCLAAFYILATAAPGRVHFWQPFDAMYQIPQVTPANLLTVATQLALVIVVYAAGRALLRRGRGSGAGSSPRPFAPWTAAVTLVFLTTASVALGVTVPRPIERPFRPGAGLLSGHLDSPPNVILIVMDTVRADHLSVYGYARPTTPNLAAFAREAVLHRQAIAPASWTYPSHASIFTGLMPTEHGAHWYWDELSQVYAMRPLDDRYTTLAEVLGDLGFRTGAVIANTVPLRADMNLHQGFTHYDARPRAGLDTARTRTLSPALGICRAVQAVFGRTLLGYWFRDARQINTDALQWLDRDDTSPFFLFLNYADAHAPYRPHAPRETRATVDPTSPHRLSAADPLESPDHRVPQALWEEMALYDGEIAYLDARIGELLAALKTRELYDDALIIITSDHGEAFGEHGFIRHENSVYQEEVAVPLLIRYPGGRRTGVSNECTPLTSVFPLILAEVGVGAEDAPPPRPGIAGPQVLSELHRPVLEHSGGQQWTARALYTPAQLKAITGSGTQGPIELYDLQQDPGETRNRACERIPLAAAAAGRVQSWVAEAKAGCMASNRVATMSPELRAQLESLGYIGSD